MKVINKKDDEIKQDKVYINNLKELIKDLKKEFKNSEQKSRNNNKELRNLQMQLYYLKNGVNNIINKNKVSNDNNINNKNYFNKNNNSINYLYKNNSSRKKYIYDKEHFTNQRYFNIINNRNLFDEKNKNKTLIANSEKKIRIIPQIINMQKYKIIKNKKNKINYSQNNNDNSLPSVDDHKTKSEIKKYIINDGGKNNLKSQLINNKPINLFNIPKLEIRDYKNISIPKIYEKHINISKKEKYEKQQIDEVKGLLDKIVSDFET